MKHPLCVVAVILVFCFTLVSPLFSFSGLPFPPNTQPSSVDTDVLWSYNSTGSNAMFTSPAIGDIDGDGDPDVVVGCNNRIYALDGHTGLVLWSFTTGGLISSTPSLADINKDGMLDVVVGSDDRRIYALDGTTGVLLWFFETDAPVKSPPALGDINGDDNLEVVVINFISHVYVLNGLNGSLVWGYRIHDQWAPDSFPDILNADTSPALGDIDGDGDCDIVVASNYYSVTAFDGTTGGFLWRYDSNITNLFYGTSPALVDIDQDGGLDVLIGWLNASVIALQGATGSLLWGSDKWYGLGRIALGDVNGDGTLDAVIGGRTGQSHAESTVANDQIFALDTITGTLLWVYEANDIIGSSPSLADVDGDGGLDVLIVDLVDGPCVLDGTSGKLLWSHSYDLFSAVTPVVYDIDDDGDLDLIGGSGALYAIELSTHSGRIFWEGLSGDISFQRRGSVEVIDSDNDLLSTYSESMYGTNPSLNDTDFDGMPDGWEVSNSLDPLVNDATSDLDGDGLTNIEEFHLGTLVTNPDTDHDGFSDGLEVALSFNPLDPFDGLLVCTILAAIGGFLLTLGGTYALHRFLKKRSPPDAKETVQLP